MINVHYFAIFLHKYDKILFLWHFILRQYAELRKFEIKKNPFFKVKPKFQMRPAVQVEKPVKQASKKSLLLPAKLKVCDYTQTKLFFDPQQLLTGGGSGEVKTGVKHTCYDLDLSSCLLNLLIFSCC